MGAAIISLIVAAASVLIIIADLTFTSCLKRTRFLVYDADRDDRRFLDQLSGELLVNSQRD
jgi:hypothetical protein